MSFEVCEEMLDCLRIIGNLVGGNILSSSSLRVACTVIVGFGNCSQC